MSLGTCKDDETAVTLLTELQHLAGPLHQRPQTSISAADLLLPIHIKKDDIELRLFSTIMTLGTPRDVTLQELRIETFFPADEASEEVWSRITPATDRRVSA